MVQHVQGMTGVARRNCGMPHRAEIAGTCCKPRSAEMRAAEVRSSDRMAREAAAMSAEVPSAAAKMMPAAAEAVTAAMTMAATVPASMAPAVPSAPGNGIARQRQKERKNRNSKCAPEHGTLPAVTPPITRREC
jgi:hypothetical protein